MIKKTKRNRAAQDATLINIRKLQKEIANLWEHINILHDRIFVLENQLVKKKK